MAKEKLVWFKFSPSDWMMGRIMRCSEQSQSRFIMLCCIYWNKECDMSIDDAKIEIGNDCYDELLIKNIIKEHVDYIKIDFLDVQMNEINEEILINSKRGRVGNLKRWYPDLYDKFTKKELSLEDCETIAKQSPLDRPSITTQSIEIADKRREDKRIEDKIRKEKIIPTYEEFQEHALNKKSNIDLEALKLKYDSWIENNWKDGNDKKITNWKSKLNNTIPFLKENKSTISFDINR